MGLSLFLVLKGDSEKERNLIEREKEAKNLYKNKANEKREVTGYNNYNSDVAILEKLTFYSTNIFLHFGNTNIIFADCKFRFYTVYINRVGVLLCIIIQF